MGNSNEEGERLEKLAGLGILYRPTQRAEDALVRLAKTKFGVDSAAFSFITAEEQWYKAADGIDAESCRRDQTFCQQFLQEDDVVVIDDATQDDRFSAHPAVVGSPHIKFYAMYPLRLAGGTALGTFCIFGGERAHFSEKESTEFRQIGKMAQSLMLKRDPNDQLMINTLGLSDEQQYRACREPVTGSLAAATLGRLALAKVEQIRNEDNFAAACILEVRDSNGLSIDPDTSEGRHQLREVARILRYVLPVDAMHFHDGGGIFISIFDASPHDEAEALQERLRDELADDSGWDWYEVDPPTYKISFTADDEEHASSVIEAISRVAKKMGISMG